MFKIPKFLVILSIFIIVIIITACQIAYVDNNVVIDPFTRSETPTPTSTSSPTATATETKVPTKTPQPITPTVDLNKKGTSIAQTKVSVLENLYDQNLITSKKGKYHSIAKFDKSWAQLFWYQWWPTGYKPTNFVIRADASWDSASKIANWADSGCGFVYHENGKYDHHRTYLAMDGYVYSSRYVKDVYSPLSKGYYGKLKTPSDSANIMLVVDQQWVTFFVNGKKVVHFQDSKLKGGYLAYTLVSGTNKDYGIHCNYTNVELWELPDQSPIQDFHSMVQFFINNV
jgi:hypothetical protein